MNIVQLEIDEIEGLWSRLNDLHYKLSKNFKEHFKSLAFEDRREKILANEKLLILGAEVEGTVIGYSISTINQNAGKVYSLFVDPDYRGANIGKTLLDHSVEWFKNDECASIRVYVAEGNEQALPFYEALGFKSRFHVLQLT